MGETPLVIAPRGRDLVGHAPTSAAIVTVTVAFGLLGGPVAAALVVVPAVGLVLGGPLLAFVAGTIALVGAGEAVGLAPIPGLLGIASFPLAATYDEHGPRHALLYLATIGATVGTFVVARATVGGLLATAVTLVSGIALVGYGVHRYELVTLGLVDE